MSAWDIDGPGGAPRPAPGSGSRCAPGAARHNRTGPADLVTRAVGPPFVMGRRPVDAVTPPLAKPHDLRTGSNPVAGELLSRRARPEVADGAVATGSMGARVNDAPDDTTGEVRRMPGPPPPPPRRPAPTGDGAPVPTSTWPGQPTHWSGHEAAGPGSPAGAWHASAHGYWNESGTPSGAGLRPAQWGAGEPYARSAGSMPGLPSRALTIVITALFGPFGLIPAYLHGKRAEGMGGSSGRYYTAFGITFGAAAVAYVGVAALLLTGVFAAAPDVSAGSVPVATAAGTSEPGSQGQGADPEQTTAKEGGATDTALNSPGTTWTARQLADLVDPYIDDESQDWSAFDMRSEGGSPIVTIPCGGVNVHGTSPAATDLMAGGAYSPATAEVFPNAGRASAELARLRVLADSCGHFQHVGLVDTLECDSTGVTQDVPVLRYGERCVGAANDAPYYTAIVQSGNAVLSLSAATEEELDGVLASVSGPLGIA
jgi:hypothetical protein